MPEQEWSNLAEFSGHSDFPGILGQPRELQPKLRNEIPENVSSIRSPTRNFRNFWSNGKRPASQDRSIFAPAYLISSSAWLYALEAEEDSEDCSSF